MHLDQPITLALQEQLTADDSGFLLAILSGTALCTMAYVLIRKHHRLRVLEAKIEVAKLVADKATKMAEAAIKRLPNCDWELFRFMVHALHENSLDLGWHAFHPISAHAVEIRSRLLAELSRGNPLFHGILEGFEKQCSRIYRYSHPFQYWLFILWSLIRFGGFVTLARELHLNLRAKFSRYFGFRDAWVSYRQELGLTLIAIRFDSWLRQASLLPQTASRLEQQPYGK